MRKILVSCRVVPVSKCRKQVPVRTKSVQKRFFCVSETVVRALPVEIRIAEGLRLEMLARAIHCVICFLATFAKASLVPESILDIAVLNKQDTLFDKKECLLFLYSMTSEDTKVRYYQCFTFDLRDDLMDRGSINYVLHSPILQDIHISSTYGTYSINNPVLKKPTPLGFPEFSCIIGIAYIEKVLPYVRGLVRI